jgi:uncharacterized protein
MIELIEHLVHPLIQHPEDMQVNVTEGDSVLLIELSLHDDDIEAVQGENGDRLQAVRHLLSVASGPRKPSLELISAKDAEASEGESDELSAEDETASAGGSAE